jgi:ADP-ribose pyrophosphatase YjhB (NUDIX family)
MKVLKKNSETSKPNQPLIPGVCAIIINKDNEILLHKRTGGGGWTLPGGKMNIGESISDCCKREIKEELKMDVRIKKVTGIYTSPDYVIDFGNGLIFQPFIVAFLCKVDNKEFTINSESVDAKWFKSNEISKLKLFSNTMRIINDSFNGNNTYFD